MDPANNEYVIKVKDVLYVILKKLWLMIIVGLVAGAGLFYINFSKVETVKSNDVLDITKKLNAGESDFQYQIRVQKIERAKVISQMINNTSIQIEYEQSYISEAVYMKIDPNNTYLSTTQFTLVVDGFDDYGIDNALFTAYDREHKAGNYLVGFAEKYETKPDYIKELIAFSTIPANDTVLNLDKDINRVGSM